MLTVGVGWRTVLTRVGDVFARRRRGLASAPAGGSHRRCDCLCRRCWCRLKQGTVVLVANVAVDGCCWSGGGSGS